MAAANAVNLLIFIGFARFKSILFAYLAPALSKIAMLLDNSLIIIISSFGSKIIYQKDTRSY